MKLNKKIFIIYITFLVTICLVILGKNIKIDKEYFEQLVTLIKKSSIYMKIMDNKGIEKKNEEGNIAEKSSDGPIKETIENISKKFVSSCFARNESGINSLLAKDTDYIRSPDGSSFIRYTGEGLLVEGYMDTDKNLADFRQRWCYVEGDKALAGVEITLKGQNVPVIWYLYYRKENGQWKLYMLENDYTPTEPAL